MRANEQLRRIRDILEIDRLGIGASTKSLLKSDLKTLFEDYFTVKDVSLDVESSCGEFTFKISVRGEAFKSVKSF